MTTHTKVLALSALALLSPLAVHADPTAETAKKAAEVAAKAALNKVLPEVAKKVMEKLAPYGDIFTSTEITDPPPAERRDPRVDAKLENTSIPQAPATGPVALSAPGGPVTPAVTVQPASRTVERREKGNTATATPTGPDTIAPRTSGLTLSLFQPAPETIAPRSTGRSTESSGTGSGGGASDAGSSGGTGRFDHGILSGPNAHGY